MKNRKLAAILAVAVAMALLAGCAPAKPFTVGAFDAKVYSNDFFNMTFTVPDSWAILSNDQIKATAGATDEMLAVDGDDLSKKQTLYLAYVMKYDPENAADFNSNFSFMSTNLGLLAYTVKSNKDFLQSAIDESTGSLTAQGIECKFGDIETKKLGGAEFAVAQATTTYSGIEFYQRMYCSIQNKYAIMFTLTWMVDEDIKTLESIVDSIEFGK